MTAGMDAARRDTSDPLVSIVDCGNSYDVVTKKYYCQLECCDSIFALLRRALEHKDKPEVLKYSENECSNQQKHAF